ncbi:MAG: DUF2937 family protein, partial [Gammaproteobacteria bacterium]|nr:DUF2937 family protein [Gammaproteobacteria bacterium]
MRLLRGLLERLLLLGTVIAGGLLPGFVAQYRQRLGGRLDQARLDLEPWQRLADQFHQGSLQRLIEYHLDSADPKFHAEGAVIRGLLDTVHQLEAAVAGLNGSLWHQLGYLALHADPRLAAATWHDWVPTFALDRDGLLFAALLTLVVWV